ncbi:MAG: HipA domain-containing protein, partial [Ramlibacter sp.]|nr:HipA domain-containing protein [Ramlibacter sp.]
MDKPYVPTDSLTLWYLGSPASPQLVGELNLQHGGRAVALAYAPGWLLQGFALSEDLPLASGLFVARQTDTAVGSVDGARPDRWGGRVIRKFEVSPRLSILEYLLFAGDDRYGALGVSQRDDVYVPWHRSPLPSVESLDEIAEVVRKVLANEPVPQPQRRLIQPGVSLGGARPKSLVAINGEQWLVKFPEGDELDMPLIEHATMKLARACGIDAAPTQALPLHHQHAVAIRRFDRLPGRRLHAISANVALRAAGETQMSYLHLSQLLRRLARADEIAAQQHELYRRMVFNIVMDNPDDHEKNHGLLRLDDGHHCLTP